MSIVLNSSISQLLLKFDLVVILHGSKSAEKTLWNCTGALLAAASFSCGAHVSTPAFVSVGPKLLPCSQTAGLIFAELLDKVCVWLLHPQQLAIV